MTRPKHTPEARKMRRELDKLLAAVSEATGDELAWDGADLELIAILLGQSTERSSFPTIIGPPWMTRS
jgi:hypothetical protein